MCLLLVFFLHNAIPLVNVILSFLSRYNLNLPKAITRTIILIIINGIAVKEICIEVTTRYKKG